MYCSSYYFPFDQLVFENFTQMSLFKLFRFSLNVHLGTEFTDNLSKFCLAIVSCTRDDFMTRTNMGPTEGVLIVLTDVIFIFRMLLLTEN